LWVFVCFFSKDPVAVRVEIDSAHRIEEDSVAHVGSIALEGSLIGKVPNEVIYAQINGLLAAIPLPQKGALPVQNCVTWTAFIREIKRVVHELADVEFLYQTVLLKFPNGGFRPLIILLGVCDCGAP
jgi:hypothetical protein